MGLAVGVVTQSTNSTKIGFIVLAGAVGLAVSTGKL
jgi:hypothetical protein